MSTFTFEEKLEYNRKRANKGNDFAGGYIMGVSVYTAYVKCNAAERQFLRGEVGKMYAKCNGKDKTPFSEGYCCGYRDAANARKARAKQRDAARAAQRENKRSPFPS